LNKHIKKAIIAVGGQANLAEALNVTQPFISLVLNEIKQVPASFCMKIEHITQGEITAIDLRPDIFSAIED